MTTMSSKIRILLIVVFVFVSIVAIIFPYPVLTKFLFSMICDYAFLFWGCYNRITETDVNNLRIALTPTILVSIGLFFIIRKLGAVIDNNAYRFVRYVSLVVSWYCLIATALVIATMWLGMMIGGNETGMVVSFGYFLNSGAIR